MKTIGFIGCGNMAQPIIRNVAEKNVFDKNDIFVYDIDREKLEDFCSKTQVNAAESENYIALCCDVVVLCTKPQVFPVLLGDIRASLCKNRPLIISIAAGKTTRYISDIIGEKVSVARIFPNLNAQVGEAVSAYTGNENVSTLQLEKVGEICKSFGEAKYMSESMFSVFGVLGGCVPAYAFMFIGALAKAAQENGMDSETAREVAVQAVLGSAKLLKEQGGSIDGWIDKVCSPGGTTIQGITSLRQDELEQTVARAFGKSYRRDIELSGNC